MRARLRHHLYQLQYGLGLTLLVLMSLSGVFHSSLVQAAELKDRSVMLGTAIPSAADTYDFDFFVPSITMLGSISFDFCSNSPILGDSCSPPNGLDVTGANLGTQTGNTGFSVDGSRTTANHLVLTRPPLAAASIQTHYSFTNIVNPSAMGNTTFVRITTYATADTTGAFTDNGSVAYVTATRFQIGAFVPPFLQLCVGITVTPNCSAVSGDRIDLGILSVSHARAGTSQFSAGTNSPSGYAVFSLGTTMTSGNNVIPSLSFASSSSPGMAQFGMNLRANLSPAVGSDPVGTGIASPTTNYDQPNKFTFNDGDMLASSTQPSNYNRMTVSYLANIPGSQIPGVYSTTITYEAVAQF